MHMHIPYIHTCIHIYTYTYTHTQSYKSVDAYARLLICKANDRSVVQFNSTSIKWRQLYSCIHAYIHTHIHTHTRIYPYTHITYIHTHIYIHTYIHIYIYTHTHTHTQSYKSVDAYARLLIYKENDRSVVQDNLTSIKWRQHNPVWHESCEFAVFDGWDDK